MGGFKNKLPSTPKKLKIDKVKLPRKALNSELAVKIPTTEFACIDSLPDFLKKRLEKKD